MLKIRFGLLLLLSVTSINAIAATFQVGVGLSKQRLNTGSFQKLPGESRGHFDFTSLELRASFLFLANENANLGIEGQFHQSLQAQNSTAGSINFQEYAFSLIANLSIWKNFGGEVGGTFFSLLTAPKKGMENPSGVGILYGITYLLDEDWQIRLRREDKLLASSYDIQPGYSFSISYLF